MDFEKLKNLYNDLYQIGLDIIKRCDEGKFEELQECFTRKNFVFEETQKFQITENSTEFSIEELNILKNLVKKIEENDKKILGKIEKHKEKLRKEINSISEKAKVISAYKLNLSEYNPILFDTKE